MTALVLIPLIFFIFYKGETWVTYFFIIMGIGLMGEWVYNLLTAQKSVASRLYLLALGTPYIFFGTLGFYQIYDQVPFIAFQFLMIIWITDTAAFFVGRTLGGPKLCPSISPNKTWSGAMGGLLFSFMYVLIAQKLFPESFANVTMAIFPIISIVGQLGDLLESAAKRFLKIKDTSQLLPGHGGLLDRMDSFLAVGFFNFLMFAF